MLIGITALTACGLSLFNDMCRKPEAARTESLAEQAIHQVEGQMGSAEAGKIHMDLTSDTDHLPVRTVVTRAGIA